MLLKNAYKKRILSFCLTISLIFSMLAIVHADTGNKGYVFEYGDTEVTISGDIDSQKAEMIANKIEGVQNVGISPLSILCIFGHSKAYTTAFETQHNYYTTVPRCRRNTYSVEYCTRSSCDYCVYTFESFVRVSCH